MNSSRKIILSIFLCLSALKVSAIFEPPSDNASDLEKFVFALGFMTEIYLLQYPDEKPEVICTNCQQKKLELNEFSSGLLGKIIEDVADENCHFEKAEIILKQFITHLAHATPSELEKFLLQAANNLKYECSQCGGTVWEKIATAEKTSPTVHKKSIHLPAQ